MRITSIDIINFVAVRDFHLNPSQITIIHGPNESLKTMILDSTLLTLFSQVGFPRVRDRYSEEDLVGAAASVVMNNGEEFTLAGRGNLERTLNLPRLSARNLVVVRGGELSFHEESGWWGSIRDNLTGFEGGLGRVEQNIRSEAGLFPKKRDYNEEIQRRIQDMKQKKVSLENAQLTAQNVNTLQIELSMLERGREECRRRIKELEAARERDRYRMASGLMRDFSGAEVELETYQRYREEDYKGWLAAERALGEARIRVEDLKTQRTKLEREMEDKRRERDELSRKIGEGEARAVNVLNEIKRTLQDLDVKKLEADRASEGEHPVEVLAIMSSAVAAVFLYFSLERGWAYLLGVVGSAVAALFLWKGWFDRRGKRLVFTRLKRDLFDQARPIFPAVSDVEEIRGMLDEQGRVLNETKGKRESLEKNIAGIDRDLNELRNKFDCEQREEEAAAARVDELRKNMECSTSQELRQKLDRKRQLEIEIESHRQQVNQILGVSSEREWQEALRKLEPYADATGEWDGEEYERLRTESVRLEQSIGDAQRRFQSARDAIIRAKCNTPEEVFIELDNVNRELEEYGMRKEAALAAIDVLNGIATDQDRIINSVIGDGPQSAQAYFERITGGRYSEVFRDGNVVRTKMPEPDEKEFSIDQLSTGTQAQLYFALRVSLIKRIFDEPSFLLLDDPFLSADEGRLQTIMDFLIELAREGWQIIYFTVDERVPVKLERAGAQLFSLVSLPPA